MLVVPIVPYLKDPWIGLEAGVPYYFVHKPKWVNRIGGKVLVAVCKQGTDEVFSFISDATCMPTKDLRAFQPFVIRDGVPTQSANPA